MNTCGICHQSLLTGRLAGLQCSHVFHSACIAQWEEESWRCPDPECQRSIVRHGLHLDFSPDVTIFRNIQSMAESVIANVTNMDNATAQRPVGGNANVDGNNSNGILVNNGNNNDRNMVGVDDVLEVSEFRERVRYEMPSEDQANYIRQFRGGDLNVRLLRRVLLRTEGEPDINGCKAIIWFSNNQ